MGIFGWDLPPGCSVRDIEHAFGNDPPENCLGCGKELTEENDPDGFGLCSSECLWPAIGAQMKIVEEDRAATEAEVREYNRMRCPQYAEFGRVCVAHENGSTVTACGELL